MHTLDENTPHGCHPGLYTYNIFLNPPAQCATATTSPPSLHVVITSSEPPLHPHKRPHPDCNSGLRAILTVALPSHVVTPTDVIVPINSTRLRAIPSKTLLTAWLTQPTSYFLGMQKRSFPDCKTSTWEKVNYVVPVPGGVRLLPAQRLWGHGA